MSASRMSELLLRCYPRAWRARYGEELRGLIADMSGGGRTPWRIGSDVALAGVRERLRAAGLGDHGAPGARARAGALLVLCAWALFVVAGATLQRVSEHWQQLMPQADRSLPAAAFAAIVVAAACGGALVLAGIAVALRPLVAFLRAGGWPQVRRSVLVACGLTGLAAVATAGLVAWAHGLRPAARNGGDGAYGAAFVAWALLLVACLGAWTSAAVAIARRLMLPVPALRACARLACAVTAAMAAATAATSVWWAALGGRAQTPELIVIVALMALATLAGLAGARRSWRTLPALSGS